MEVGFLTAPFADVEDAIAAAHATDVRSLELAHAEHAFRTLKGPELEIRPINHRLAPEPLEVGASSTVILAAAPTPRCPTSPRSSAAAPPAVAARSASMGVRPISRTASAMTNGIELEKHVPGLQSVASATRTPASTSARASG